MTKAELDKLRDETADKRFPGATFCFKEGWDAALKAVGWEEHQAIVSALEEKLKLMGEALTEIYLRYGNIESEALKKLRDGE